MYLNYQIRTNGFFRHSYTNVTSQEQAGEISRRVTHVIWLDVVFIFWIAEVFSTPKFWKVAQNKDKKKTVKILILKSLRRKRVFAITCTSGMCAFHVKNIQSAAIFISSEWVAIFLTKYWSSDAIFNRNILTLLIMDLFWGCTRMMGVAKRSPSLKSVTYMTPYNNVMTP